MPGCHRAPTALLLPGGVIQEISLRLDSREHSVAGDRPPALSPPEILLRGTFSPPLPPHARPAPTKEALHLPPTSSAPISQATPRPLAASGQHLPPVPPSPCRLSSSPCKARSQLTPLCHPSGSPLDAHSPPQVPR